MHRRTTIRDVARHAGVSVTTVSYVLNGKAGISEETCRRVRAAAESLHYMPNALIRSLQRKRSNVIGIYLWPLKADASAYIYTDLLRGVTDALADTEYDLLVYAQRPGRFADANVNDF